MRKMFVRDDGQIVTCLPPDAEPLPEARGGKRSGAGKPKKSDDVETEE